MGINGDFFGNLGRMQTGLKKPRLYIHHLFGLMQFTVQYCFHVICMYVPKCRERRHRQISGRFPMSHVDLGYFREGGLRSHVDLGTIGLTGLRSQDDMGQNPRWYTALDRSLLTFFSQCTTQIQDCFDLTSHAYWLNGGGLDLTEFV